MQITTYATGMYIIDENYRMIYCNPATLEMYPEVKLGEFCYQTLAHQDRPCPICPLRTANALIYNPDRREWIASDAAEMEVPGVGLCHSVHFHLKQRINKSDTEMISDEEAMIYLGKLDTSLTGAESIIGCYCEEGFPLFYASEQMAATLGYESLEAFRQGIDGLVINTIHPDDRPQFLKDVGGDFVEGQTYETVYRMPKRDGSWFWGVDKGVVIVAPNGKLAILSYRSDITLMIQRQEAILQQNAFLRKNLMMTDTMMQNMPSGYHRCAAQEGCPFLFIGDHFCQIVGWSREEIQQEFGNLYHNLIWPEDTGVMETFTDMLKKQGKGNIYDTSIYRTKRKGGGYRWVLDSTMFVDLGEESFFQGTIADITEFVEGQEEQKRLLKEALSRIEKISQAKSSFLFNISHDLRTPMNAIKGFTHMLSRNPDDGAYVRQMLGKIDQSSDTLMQLLGDVLELSRIESGKEQLELTAVDLRAFCDKLHLMFIQEMDQAGIRFTMETDIRDCCVLCDELKCTRIVMNMLSNAGKFTKAGGSILFRVEQLESNEPNYGVYRFSVKDTGIGMSQEFLERAFEEFEREKTSTDSGVTGSGLGLAIIRKLSELMGGRCHLESTQGVGTTISAQLRLRQIPEAICPCNGTKQENKPDFRGNRVLLVEDNAFNREIARFVLEDLGLEVEEANDGQEALDRLKAAGAGQYDLILMDLQMPHMDGYTATTAIRALPDAARSGLPIIAMTANAFAEDKEKCLAVGMNGHISKPIDPGAVAETLAQYLATRA